MVGRLLVYENVGKNGVICLAGINQGREVEQRTKRNGKDQNTRFGNIARDACQPVQAWSKHRSRASVCSNRSIA